MGRSTAQWLAQLGEVADELGYGIVEITPSRIVLEALDQTSTRVTVDCRLFLDATLLRRVLRDPRMSDAV